VLIVRGLDEKGQPAGRNWLHEQLQNAGVDVHTWYVYKRILLPQTARSGVWILSSSFSIQALQGEGWEQCDAIATHRRIADAALEKNFQRIWICKPHAQSLLDCLQTNFGTSQHPKLP
jgi:uroporphyrinogen-III synthase